MKQDDTLNLTTIKKKLNILKNDAFSWPKTEVSTEVFSIYRSTVEVSRTQNPEVRWTILV
jgi:hypothetical protein